MAQLIEDYRKADTAKAEEQAVRQLAQDWQQYLITRDEMMSLILAGDIRAAVERDLREGASFFERARDDLKKSRHSTNQKRSCKLPQMPTRRAILLSG